MKIPIKKITLVAHRTRPQRFGYQSRQRTVYSFADGEEAYKAALAYQGKSGPSQPWPPLILILTWANELRINLDLPSPPKAGLQFAVFTALQEQSARRYSSKGVLARQISASCALTDEDNAHSALLTDETALDYVRRAVASSFPDHEPAIIAKVERWFQTREKAS